MKPIELRITRFRSFKEETVFRFPDGPGLFFMWGENREEPRLEANGSGKSSLWEALIWCLYGKTSRGLKAGDAANWEGGKGCRVAFVYEMWGIPLTVERTWGPISWSLIAPNGHRTDLTKDETNSCLEELKLEFTAFLQCVVMAQAQPMFLDLKADQKAALFSEVLGLDRWLDLSAKAGKKAAGQDLVSRDLERSMASMRGKLEQLDGKDLEALDAAWRKAQHGRVADVDQRHGQDLAKLKKAEAYLVETEAAEASARAEYKMRLKASQAQAEVRAEAQHQRDLAGRHFTRAEDAVEAALKHSKAMVDFCPICAGPITDKHRKNAQSTLDEANDLADDAMVALNKADFILERESKEFSNATRKLQDALEFVQAAEMATKDARREIGLLGRSLDALEAEAEKLEDEASPYADLLDRADDARKQLGRDLRKAEADHDESESQRSLFQSWVRWFKEIRLSMISEALTQLEVEVNSCVNALGLVDWELRFEVDRETKGGTLQRGFSVSVVSPHNLKPVPWEAWSGGESQRLRVATQQGLADLIRSRTGTGLALEVWDEPTQWMSGQGVTDLLDSLAVRAKAERRQIWIVDHRSLGYGGFDGNAGAIKTEAGTTFDQSGLYISDDESEPQRQGAGSGPAHDVGRARAKTRRTPNEGRTP